MAEQIRSADLLVKTALSSYETMNELKTNPEETLKKLGSQVVKQLPRLEPPTGQTNDKIWLIIVVSLCIAMLISVLVLGVGVFKSVADATKQVTRADTILTVFTTVVGFLAGLLSPSPLGKKGL